MQRRRLKLGTRLGRHLTVLGLVDPHSGDPVYLMWHHKAWCPMACKVFGSLHLAQREADRLQRLDHPGIVRCLGVEQPACLLMEFLEGPTVRKFARARRAHKLPHSDALRIANPPQIPSASSAGGTGCTAGGVSRAGAGAASVAAGFTACPAPADQLRAGDVACGFRSAVIGMIEGLIMRIATNNAPTCSHNARKQPSIPYNWNYFPFIKLIVVLFTRFNVFVKLSRSGHAIWR